MKRSEVVSELELPLERGEREIVLAERLSDPLEALGPERLKRWSNLGRQSVH